MSANPTEKWVQRTAAEYAQAFDALLPTGPAWPHNAGTALEAVVRGQTQIWGGVVEAEAAALLTIESDPRKTVMLLPDWERAWGLPDLCLDEPLTIADRQNALVGKMTTIGAQSRAFFTAQALRVGYVVTIHEWSPFMCGISMCGDTRNLDNGVNYRWEIGGPTMRYYWAVRVGALRFSWFRASSGQAGIDPMLRIGIATDLECLLRRLAPAHTDLIFDYSIIAELDFNKPFDSGYIEMLPM